MAQKGFSHSGTPIPLEQQQRAIKAATDRMDEIKRILASGVQGPKR